MWHKGRPTRTWLTVLLMVVVALLIVGSAPFLVNMTPAAAQGDESEGFSPGLAGELAKIYQQKRALTLAQRKVGSNILETTRKVKERIAATPPGQTPKFGDLSTPLLKIDDAGNIETKLTVTSLTAEQLEQLEGLGMNVGLTLPKYGIIEGSLPYNQVEAVAGLDFIRNVATPGYAVRNTGSVTSVGDTVLRAAEARTAFSVDGTGVKVGVMSDGVTNRADSVASGDLPSDVDVRPGKAGSGDEGTAMLEIIYDLAPGADLAFYSPGSSSDMVAGIGNLETAGCDVIVDDLTFFDEPKFEDGPIAQRARQFVADGGIYATSAGNNAQRHYMGTYVRSASSPYPGYAYAHNYNPGGTEDIGNTFTIPDGGLIIVVLQWNNQWGHSGDDFDLFLRKSSDGEVLAYGADYQTGNDNPWEELVYINVTGGNVVAYIAVFEYAVANPASMVLDYNVYYGSGLQYVTAANSLIGHSAVEEVLSSAAAYSGSTNPIEDYSSRGPGTVYFPSQQNRQVPNITGVDGVHTTGPGTFPDPFYGTSAAAPHVGAIAALVLDKNDTWTPAQVRHAILSKADDKGDTGRDDTWGWGLIDAYDAVGSSLPTATSRKDSNNDGIPDQDWETFSDYATEHIVYISSAGLLPSYNYRMAYYDSTGAKRDTQDFASDTSGNLTTHHTFVNGTDQSGTWRVIVTGQTQAYTPPSLYDSTWAYTFSEDTFTVTDSAIPEFPTALAGIAALALSAGVYLWMRRKVATARA